MMYYKCVWIYLDLQPTTIDLYADDTTMYFSNKDKLMLESTLQSSLNCLQRWCRENGMILNIEKTKVMLIASRQKKKNCFRPCRFKSTV